MIWQWVLGAIATIVVAWLGVRSAIVTANASKQTTTTQTSAQERKEVLAAWQDLLEPYKREVGELRAELAEERRARGAEIAEEHRSQEVKRKELEDQLTTLKDQVVKQADEIQTWKRMARVLARWGTVMRDEILRLGGTAPAPPAEMLTLQALDDDALDRLPGGSRGPVETP